MKNVLRKFIIIFFFSFPSLASCQTWESLGGPGYQVVSKTLYDSTNSCYYLVGYFKEINGIVVNHVAKWDGTAISPMGNGFNGDVIAAVFYNNELIVCGNFDSSGTKKFKTPLAKWTGSDWEPLDSTFVCDNPNIPGNNANIAGMAVYKNRLYFSGNFNDVTNGLINGLVYWDGTGFHRGLFEWAFPSFDYFSDIYVFKNEMYVRAIGSTDTCAVLGINFSNISGFYKFDTICEVLRPFGNFWYQGEYITCMHITDSLAYIGLITPKAIGNYITAFDGVNFYPMGVGLNDRVECIGSYDGKIVIGGRFTNLYDGSMPLQRMAFWDGVNYSPIPAQCSFQGYPYDINVIDSTLIVSGVLVSCNLDSSINSTAVYPNYPFTGIFEFKNKHAESIIAYFNDNELNIKNIPSSFINTKIKITIYTIDGRLIRSYQQLCNQNEIKLDANQIRSGLYLVRLETTSNYIAGKVLKM